MVGVTSLEVYKTIRETTEKKIIPNFVLEEAILKHIASTSLRKVIKGLECQLTSHIPKSKLPNFLRKTFDDTVELCFIRLPGKSEER